MVGTHDLIILLIKLKLVSTKRPWIQSVGSLRWGHRVRVSSWWNVARWRTEVSWLMERWDPWRYLETWKGRLRRHAYCHLFWLTLLLLLHFSYNLLYLLLQLFYHSFLVLYPLFLVLYLRLQASDAIMCMIRIFRYLIFHAIRALESYLGADLIVCKPLRPLEVLITVFTWTWYIYMRTFLDQMILEFLISKLSLLAVGGRAFSQYRFIQHFLQNAVQRLWSHRVAA